MGRNDCQVCASPERAAIDVGLQTGSQLKDLAVTFNVSKYALSRHKAKHLEASAVEVQQDGAGDDSREVEKWLGRAEQIFQTSVVDGNVKGMVDSLSAALRALETRAKTREREAEAAAEQGEGIPPITVAQLDDLLEKFDETMTPDRRVIEKVLSEVRVQLVHHGSFEQWGLLERFLELSLPNGGAGPSETLAAFRVFVTRRTPVTGPPQPAPIYAGGGTN
jgi:hypothetical protein